MDTGNFRHKALLQQKVVTRDGYGGENIVFNDIVTLRGSITYKSGKDGFTADQFYGKNVIEFKTRYYPTLIADRLVYDSRDFDIIPPIKNVMEENRFMIITAVEEL